VTNNLHYLENGSRCKLVFTTRKSHLSFRLVPKSVKLNDLELRMTVILRHYTEGVKYILKPAASNCLRLDLQCLQLKFIVQRI